MADTFTPAWCCGRRRRGAALPATLVVLFWLTGVTGWLVAHVIWAGRSQAEADAAAAHDAAADAVTLLAVQRLATVGDWAALVASAALEPCSGAASLPPLAEAIDVTARMQAASDAVSRWPAGVRPEWRRWLACGADDLGGDWRGRAVPPWTMALVGDDPDAHALDGPSAQLVVVGVAWSATGGRAIRVATVRRTHAVAPPRIVGWRGG